MLDVITNSTSKFCFKLTIIYNIFFFFFNESNCNWTFPSCVSRVSRKQCSYSYH